MNVFIDFKTCDKLQLDFKYTVSLYARLPLSACLLHRQCAQKKTTLVMEGYGTPNATDGSTQSKQTSQSKRRMNVFVHKFWPL